MRWHKKQDVTTGLLYNCLKFIFCFRKTYVSPFLPHSGWSEWYQYHLFEWSSWGCPSIGCIVTRKRQKKILQLRLRLTSMSDMAVFLSTTMKFGLLEEWDKFSNTYPLSSSPVLIQLTNATQEKPNTCVLKKMKRRLCTVVPSNIHLISNHSDQLSSRRAESHLTFSRSEMRISWSLLVQSRDSTVD